MLLKELIEKTGFTVLNDGENLDVTLSKVFCCDLLSFAMARNPEASVWVTVMGNINSVAVAALTEGGCIVLAENSAIDENALAKAKTEGICVLRTSLPIFEAALMAHKLITGEI